MPAPLRSIPRLFLWTASLLVLSLALLAPQAATAQNCLHCPGLAPNFSGSDTGFQDGSKEAFSDRENTQLTTEFWFKADAVANVTQMLWEQGQAYDGMNFYIHEGTLYAGMWSNNGTFKNHWISTDQVTSGTWHHVVFTYDYEGSADRTALYLDGELIGTDTPGYQMIQYNGDHGLAGVNSNTNTHTAPGGGQGSGDLTFDQFQGRIDQFRVWRAAFSQEEVRSRRQRRLWNAEFDAKDPRGISIGSDTLDLHYPFNLSDAENNPGWGYVGVSGRGITENFTFESSDFPLTTRFLDATDGPVTDNARGSDGTSVEVTLSSDSMLVSYHGSSGGDPIDVSSSAAVTRVNLAWVLDPVIDETRSPDVTFNYSGVAGIGDATPPPVLLRRTDPEGSWTDVTSNWNHDTGNDTFTQTDVTVNGFAEYAVGRPFVVVNDDDGSDPSGPCDAAPDESTISSGLSQVPAGETVYACPGSYSEAVLDVQEDVTLLSGSSVAVSDVLALNSTFDVTSGSLTLTSEGESSSARIAGSGSGTINGEVTARRFLERDDGNAEDSHWRFVASPVDAALDNAGGGGAGSTFNGSPLLSNTWTQGDGMTGANFQDSGTPASVLYYDETADVSDASQGWAAVGDLTNPTDGPDIESQEGFAVYLFEDQDYDGSADGFPRTLTATGPVAEENTGNDVTLPVTCTDNDGNGCTDDSDGWNLVANPFVSHFDWKSGNVTKAELEAPAYVYDADNNEYDQTNGTNGGDEFIAPFQAFFVKSNAADGNEGNVSLSVNSGAKAVPPNDGDAEFKSTENEPLVSLQLSHGDSETEETRVTYRDGAEASKDRFDGYQLTPLSGDYHLLASEMEGRPALFDSQYRPAPAKADTIALALDLTEGGTYTLETDTLQNLPSGWNVILENTDSGARWDLGAGQSATFSVEGTQSKSTAEETSPAELLKDGPTVATADGNSDLPSYRLYVGPEAVLPVELASLDAATKGTDVQLSWQTASETGNAGFAIERRAEGGSWSQIGFREGAGTTEQAQTYRFTDTEVPFEAEQVRYRLRQKDFGGTTTLSDEVTVELGAPPEARLHAPFPNPSTQQATVRYEVPQQSTVEIAVYDVLGRRVETIVNGQVPAGREQRAVQTDRLAPGTYFIRMRMGETVQTERLTIVR